MSKDAIFYIAHILESIEHIEDYTTAHSKENFLGDHMCYDAVLRNLQTMAESTKRLPETIKEHYPSIPWKDIAGFRNVLVHDYLEGLDPDILWNVITKELPTLKQAMLDECPNWNEIKKNKRS